MLTLASMVLVAYMWVGEQMHMSSNVIPPVVIEVGKQYKYNDIESAVYVPGNWNDNCYNQQQTVLMMAEHYNNYLNGNHKKTNEQLVAISKKWVCVKDN